MDKNVLSLIGLIAVIMFIVALTVFSFFRSRIDFARISSVTDHLARQARPKGKGFVVGLTAGILCIVLSLILDYLNDPAGLRPAFVPLITALGLLSTWLINTFYRIHALETIVRLTRPDIYAQIRGGKAGGPPGAAI